MSFCARCSAINRRASSSICVTTRSREGGISCASRNNSGVLGGTHIKRPGHPGPGEPWFCVAGIWRTDKDVGEAFTMLTMPPGLDIAPYHDRQIAILDRADWAAWLDPSTSAKTILRPLSAGSLAVEQVG